MVRKYFGTDGIRGTVGQEPMTTEFALRLASAAARALAPEGGTVAIGKDTRVSGYMFESALEAGFVAAGMDVILLGPVPTPGIAYLTRSTGADLGVVISASHNPYHDNGIKFFDRQGRKLSDEIEAKIEAGLKEGAITRPSESLGRATRMDTARTNYQWFCLSSVPPDLRLEGMKIVFDGANGAAYKVAPRVLSELGADIVPIGCSPNGRNINADCGSTHPELLKTTVTGVGADLGIALDGDGDRVVMVDHTGALIDGDQLLFVMANARQNDGTLVGPVVGTLMSNLGLEKSLAQRGIEFMRAKVGDRHVLEMLHQHEGVLGGETSGHLICLDKTTTGDGLISALQVLTVMRNSGNSLAELVAEMPKFPQTLVNVRVAGKPDLDSRPVKQSVSDVERQLGDRGRVVLRASGTEPVIRVMVEGEDAAEVETLAGQLAEAVKTAA
ncbi:MAG: phosphoglucosamine mutase [Gammaproteobacteria bacterium]|jgi:phosphoglucosamine mutase|nr:phosphoglucosamine mutase [Gammaproteobacteria bacterium]MDP7420009.1 phosphoglucosamine mutase [Gammaproteobacteria bacterium]HJP04068.1 phosphoglucosamine mutase [Gammaproteobacteria bacterium]